MAALRAWRTARAREDAVPPYIVLHDQTLAAIAEIKPVSAAGLRRVKGIGPGKVDSYGDEILEIVRDESVDVPCRVRRVVRSRCTLSDEGSAADEAQMHRWCRGLRVMHQSLITK